MSDELMLEILKDVQACMVRLESGQNAIRIELASLGQQVRGLPTAVNAGQDRYAEMERRINRIERRGHRNTIQSAKPNYFFGS